MPHPAESPPLLEMIQRSITYCNQTLQVTFSQQAAHLVDLVFQELSTGSAKKAESSINIAYDQQQDLFSVTHDDEIAGTQLNPTDLALLLLARSSYIFAKNTENELAIYGSVFSRNKRGVLIVGKPGSGRHLLATRLLSMGYHFVTNNVITISADKTVCTGLPLPLHLKKTDLPIVDDYVLPEKKKHILQNETECVFSHRLLNDTAVQNPLEISLLLFCDQQNNKKATIKQISSALAASRLLNYVANRPRLQVGGVPQVASMTRNVPACTVQYSRLDQLDDILAPIINNVLDTGCDPVVFKQTIEAFQVFRTQSTEGLSNPQEKAQTYCLQKVTPKGKKRKLTIGMATYDDYDGVYFSVQAIRLYHPEVTEETEILVVDNHPDGPCAKSLKKLDESVDGFRYIPLQGVQGTAVRDFIFQYASGDHVLCIDCHVMIVPGALKKLIEYYDSHPDSCDLLQGPMIYDNLHSISTHFQPVWRSGMYGIWEHDEKGDDPNGEPFDIPMQGLGLFSCRRDIWPGFNPRFYGFGGEEGYIHEKFRQAGGRTLCLPFLRWLHRFGRPMGVPYPLQWKDRVHNYLLGFQELGLDTRPIKEHFIELLGEKPSMELLDEISEEISSPFYFFDALYCITLDCESIRWKKMVRRFKALGIAKRVRVFNAIETPENHHIGCALSHRAIVESAKKSKLNNVLVFEDDALFLEKSLEYLSRSILELKKQSWNLFYLGGHKWGSDFEFVSGCSYLQKPYGLTCTHALAYNHTVYDQILSDLPDKMEPMSKWVEKNRAIDQYLTGIDGILLAYPAIASQLELLPQEDEQYRDQFSLD